MAVERIVQRLRGENGSRHGVCIGETDPVTAPPTFASNKQYVSRRGDVGFWWPYLAEILERHGLADAEREPVAGFNATYPTFLYGDVVVKLFGYARAQARGKDRLPGCRRTRHQPEEDPS